MKNFENSYIRVGINYYKIVNLPTPNGEVITKLTWSAETIRQDLGKSSLSSIPKYDGFCVVPEHLSYRSEINGFLNEYQPLPYHPCEDGKCDKILYFFKHIFKEHFEFALDYFAILYQWPTQPLPIILLVSKERGTGKTTFLNLCKAIFGANATFNDNSSFRSQFNTDWSNKLLICVDETFLDKQEDSERMKNLATAKEIKNEAKGKDKITQNFFGKFILCSNNEEKPVIIGEGETRYWVRKVNPFEKWDESILPKMIEELPAFLSFLINRPLSAKNESRMWFNPQLLKTAALEKIIRYSKPRLELELAIVIFEIMADKELDELNATIENLLGICPKSNLRADRTSIKKILVDDWGLAPAKNSLTYTAYSYTADGYLAEFKQVGRYYTIKRDFIQSKI